jgi:hypothetical protein
MKYAEAFKSLGYDIESPRQDWSAESQDGVCLSLWQKEIRMTNGAPWLDTKLHGKPLELWVAKPGNRKRMRHLTRAVKDFGGKIDVVVVTGIPGEGYGSANPWRTKENGARWHITSFEAETGHFSAEVQPHQM